MHPIGSPDRLLSEEIFNEHSYLTSMLSSFSLLAYYSLSLLCARVSDSAYLHLIALCLFSIFTQ